MRNTNRKNTDTGLAIALIAATIGWIVGPIAGVSAIAILAIVNSTR